MTKLQALTALGRWRRTTLLEAGGRVAGSALSNARSALADISAAVDDRQRLADDLLHATEAGDLARLSRHRCMELLATRSVGRLAYVARAGTPDVVPVNYVLIGEDVVLRSGVGPKLQAGRRGDVVAFEVDEIDERNRTGWSVVVHGTAELLDSRRAARLPQQPEPWAAGRRQHSLRIAVRHVEGRQLL
jgi:nitroimidazol reductase NimA-like FMN-containing flavoprotein (pyridoxamine 5'-phosphate oxidase superfamily)